VKRCAPRPAAQVKKAAQPQPKLACEPKHPPQFPDAVDLFLTSKN
jgi:hypothetical protein